MQNFSSSNKQFQSLQVVFLFESLLEERRPAYRKHETRIWVGTFGFPRRASNFYATNLLFVKEIDFTSQRNYAERNFKMFHRNSESEALLSQAVQLSERAQSPESR